MKDTLVLVDVTEANLESMPCCGVKNAAHVGRIQKNCWMRKYLKKGLRARVLVTPDGRQCGYIEYLPGEYAWRGVVAAGYLFIHCIWTFYKKYQHKGFASRMVEECVEEARKSKLNGVAVVARDGPWLASAALFLENGFEVVDTAAPDYELLVRKLKLDAPNPRFQGSWESKAKRYGRGLTIITANQCPHAVKFAREIREAAESEFGLKPRMVEIRNHKQAQNGPTPYGVFAIIHDGRVLADHQVSRTRFRNIMKKLPA